MARGYLWRGNAAAPHVEIASVPVRPSLRLTCLCIVGLVLYLHYIALHAYAHGCAQS